MMRSRLIPGWLVLACAAGAHAQTVGVEIPAGLKAEKSGRVVVFFIREGAHGRARPSDSPFFEEPQPLFGIEVSKDVLAKGGRIDLPPETEGYLGAGKGWGPMSKLPPGGYRVQAGVILTTLGGGGDWKDVPGNLTSKVGKVTWPPKEPVALKAEDVAKGRVWPKEVAGVELFQIRSKLLSEFAGREVFLQAGVRLPAKMTGGERKYAAIYEVTGFGGDHFSALMRMPPASAAHRAVQENAFQITLNANNENGHTFFMDSANNGPWAKALTEELIPALEAKYPLIAHPDARLLRGHSSGGWSTLWLVTEYPQVFGAAWSSAPDPVCFRKFENFDLYSRKNLYVDEAGKETPSQRHGDVIDMTARDENYNEHALGPNRTSGQQWASWQACWGSRAPDGSIAALYDPITGDIDPQEREQYRQYDLVERLKKDPQRLLPIYRDRVRLIVGSMDNYYLNEAVEILSAELRNLGATGGPGYVKFVEGKDHSTVFQSMEMLSIEREMLDHLKAKVPGRDSLKALP